MESPMNRAFKLRPKSFDSVGVNIAPNVLASTVANSLMQMAQGLYSVVTIRLIGCDNRIGRHHSFNKRHKGDLLYVRDNFRFNTSLALNDSENRRFSFGTAPTFTFPDTADISLIGFDNFFADKRGRIFDHKKSNLFSDPPSAFIGHAQMPFQFLSSDTVFGLAHKEYSVKPRSQRRWAFVKDRAFCWANLSATSTRIRSATFDWVKGALSTFALKAERITLFKDVREAGFIVGKVAFKVFNRVLHSYRIAGGLLVVKG